MKYKCVLQRLSEHKNIKKPTKAKLEDCTLGKFSVYNENGNLVFSCYSLENIGPSTDTPNLDKRIMPRVYNMEWTTTSVCIPKSYKNRDKKTGRGILLTCDEVMPNFRYRRIIIHIGNFPQDTEACILLGLYLSSTKGVINNSTLAVQYFYDLVNKEGIENFSLEVREIENAN